MRRTAAVLTFAVLGTACHRGPKQPVRLSVSIEPGYLQFNHAGDNRPLAAKASDPGRKAVADAKFVWRSSDTSVAIVKDGLVTSRADGIARIWAVSGQDSSFAVAVVQVPHVVTLTLQPALVNFESLGDTTTLAINNPDSLTSPRPMCLPEDDHVAVVDTSFQVHTVGNGSTIIRCRSGEAEGSMRVSVHQRIARVGVVTGLSRTLRMERDTIHLALAKVDKKNTPVDVGSPRWRSLDSTILVVDPASGAAVGVTEGTARVVGTVNGFADTTELQVIPREPVFAVAHPIVRGVVPGRGPRGVPGGGGARGVANLGPRPQSSLVGVRDILESDSVFQARSLGVQRSETPLHISFTVVQAEDEVLDPGAGSLKTSGLMFGAMLDFMPSQTFDIRIEGAHGPTLSSALNPSYNAQMTEGTVDFGLAIFPFLSLRAGGQLRGVTQLGATQRWLALRTGAEVHYDIGGVAQGVFAFNAMPIVSITRPFAEGSPYGLQGMAGLDYQTGRVSLGARYELERYVFPGGNRTEQFSQLKFRIGLNLGGQ